MSSKCDMHVHHQAAMRARTQPPGADKRVMPQAQARLCCVTMPPVEGGSGSAGALPEQPATFEQLGAHVPPASSCAASRRLLKSQGDVLTWVFAQAPRYCS